MINEYQKEQRQSEAKRDRCPLQRISIARGVRSAKPTAGERNRRAVCCCKPGVRPRDGGGQIQKCCTLQLFPTVIQECVEVRNAVGLEPDDQLALLRHDECAVVLWW